MFQSFFFESFLLFGFVAVFVPFSTAETAKPCGCGELQTCFDTKVANHHNCHSECMNSFSDAVKKCFDEKHNKFADWRKNGTSCLLSNGFCPSRLTRRQATATPTTTATSTGTTMGTAAMKSEGTNGHSLRELTEWKTYYECMHTCSEKHVNKSAEAVPPSPTTETIGNGVVENVYKHIKNCTREKKYEQL